MTTLLSLNPHPLLLPPSPCLCKPLINPHLPFSFSRRTRGELLVARSGFSHHLPEFGTAAGEILGRTEAFIYTIADAVVSSAADPVAIVEESKQKSDWFSGITD